MNYYIEDIEVGDTVRVLSNFGLGPIVTGTVDNVADDIKNGVPGIDYTDDNGSHYWAYVDQVLQVDRPVKKSTE